MKGRQLIKNRAGGSASFAHGRARAYKNKIPVRRAEPTSAPIEVTKRVIPICEWIEEKFIDPTSVSVTSSDFSGARLLRLQDFQKRILTKVFTPDARGRFPYSTILYSCPKKCLAPETLVLTAQLDWIPVGTLKPGDKLLAFDEFARKAEGKKGCGGSARRYRIAEVTETGLERMPARRLHFSNGKVITASLNHKWLTRVRGGRNLRWIETKDFREGDLLGEFLPVWPKPSTYEDGYLAGVFDGEGSIRMDGRELGFGQKENALFYEATRILLNHGVPFTAKKQRGYYKGHDYSLEYVTISGRAWTLYALGRYKPKRILRRIEEKLDGGYGNIWRMADAQIVKIEELETECVTLETSTGTFFAEGFASHNSGKTTLASAIGAWFADQIEAPNEVLCLANNQEQSAGRIFGNALPTLKHLGCQVPTAITSKPEVRLPNGTRLLALTNNFASAAGGNYGLTLWSELWTFTHERERRLWEELVPVPTRLNSVRWVETYAGFEDESDLLKALFLRIFADTSEEKTTPKASPVPGLEDLRTDERPAAWHIPEERLFAFIDHEFRMPWQQGEDFAQYLEAQAADLRETTFVRLWRNRWQSSVSQFITPAEYARSVTLKGENLVPSVFAIDASRRGASSSIVGARKVTREIWGRQFDRYQTTFVRVYDPATYKVGADLRLLGAKLGDLDLENTIAADIERLADMGLILGAVQYDPFEMHAVAMKLRKKKIPCVEFDQNIERAKADTFLQSLYRRGGIDNFAIADLEKHVTKARAKEDDKQRIRLIKGASTGEVTGGFPNDAAVAQSMAVWRASSQPAEKKKKRKSVSSSIFS